MDSTLLSRSPLFKGLSPSDTEKAVASVPYRVRRFNAGSMIAQSGEQVESFCIILQGKVKAEMVDFAGKVIKIEDLSAPDALASAFIFGKNNRYPVNVVAVTELELLQIRKTDFLKFLKSDDTLLVNFLDMISSRSQFLSEKIKFLNFKTIRSKLAHYILQNTGADGISVNLKMTQNDLADYFGVARPSVARTLGELEAEGYIVSRGKNVTILNKKGLSLLTSN